MSLSPTTITRMERGMTKFGLHPARYDEETNMATKPDPITREEGQKLPMPIFQWKARRSGDGISIDGKNADGDPFKVVGVTEIEAGNPEPIATDRYGHKYELHATPL